MCWEVVMGCSRMRMLRPGGWTAKTSAAFLLHHSCAHQGTKVGSRHGAKHAPCPKHGWHAALHGSTFWLPIHVKHMESL